MSFYNLTDRGDHVEAEPGPGTSIDSAIEAALSIAQRERKPVRFTFNEVAVEVLPTSTAGDVRALWDSWIQAAHDAYWTPERIAEAERKTMEREARDERRRGRIAEIRTRRPTMSVLDGAPAAAWKTFREVNTDPYGAGCVSYAESWALLLEEAIDRARAVLGEIDPAVVIRDQAKALSHEADYDGITGFMYGAAVAMLAQCWVHGDALRRWHNLDTQIGSEGVRANESGGVLNPALISVG